MMRGALLILLLLAGPAIADDTDEAALALADKAPTTVPGSGNWRILAETALSTSSVRVAGAPDRSQRLSLDAYTNSRLTPNWDAVFSDRLDLTWQGPPGQHDTINTLKEAYFSWRPRPDQLLDLGRINIRNGVAAGYNPTDFFRADAIRSFISVTPESLRENRLGSVMLRGQAVSTAGSLTAVYSPKLTSQPTTNAFSPDLGATNHEDRWGIVVSHQVSNNCTPQWLVYREEGQSPQVGANLTTLLSDATVAFVEWAGGQAPSLVTEALNQSPHIAFRNRLSAGGTYTTATKLSLTVEYETNSAGLDRDGWNALERKSVGDFRQYLAYAQNVQDLPSKEYGFAYVTWKDALFVHLDITALLRNDLIDHSRLTWAEIRYHWDRADLALQWQRYSGERLSAFGAVPQAQTWQALFVYFF